MSCRYAFPGFVGSVFPGFRLERPGLVEAGLRNRFHQAVYRHGESIRDLPNKRSVMARGEGFTYVRTLLIFADALGAELKHKHSQTCQTRQIQITPHATRTLITNSTIYPKYV